MMHSLSLSLKQQTNLRLYQQQVEQCQKVLRMLTAGASEVGGMANNGLVDAVEELYSMLKAQRDSLCWEALVTTGVRPEQVCLLDDAGVWRKVVVEGVDAEEVSPGLFGVVLVVTPLDSREEPPIRVKADDVAFKLQPLKAA